MPPVSRTPCARLRPLGVFAVLAAIASAACAREASAPAPAAKPEPATTIATPAPPPIDRAAQLAAAAPELDHETAAFLLADAPEGLTQRGLAESGLVLATAGFERLDPESLKELTGLFSDVYAALGASDAAFMGEYVTHLRAATLGQEDGRRGRELLSRGVNALPPGKRERLRSLLGRAIREGAQGRAAARLRTQNQQVVATAPSLAGQRPAPESADFTPGASRGTAPGIARLPDADSSERGEAYWRARMQEARADVAAAEQRLATANADGARKTFGTDPDRITCPAASRVAGPKDEAFAACVEQMKNLGLREQAERGAATAEVEAAQADLARATQALAALEDEARRANALPGWFR